MQIKQKPTVKGDGWEIDVPGDDSCLFWSVALRYLIPVLDDEVAFQQRYVKIFGNNKELHYIKKLLIHYNPFSDVRLFFDELMNRFIREDFRSRVVNYIVDHTEEFKLYFDNQAGEGAFEDYLTRMQKTTGWAGELEIRAISELLECCIVLRRGEMNIEYPERGQQEREKIVLTHVNYLGEGRAEGGGEKNHYHFILSLEIGNAYQQKGSDIAKKDEDGNDSSSEALSTGDDSFTLSKPSSPSMSIVAIGALETKGGNIKKAVGAEVGNAENVIAQGKVEVKVVEHMHVYDPRLFNASKRITGHEADEIQMNHVVDVISKHITQKQRDVFQCSVDDDISEQEFYIPLLANPYGSHSPGDDLKRVIDNFVKEESKNVFLITGTMGSGKSMFMYDYTIQLIKDIVSKKGKMKDYIPIYITLPIWRKSQKNIWDYIKERYHELDPSQMDYLQSSCNLLFILDGYDELHGYKNIIQENRLFRDNINVKIVITCRDTWLSRYNKDLRELFSPGLSPHDSTKDFNRITHYQILPFAIEHVRQYIKNFLDVCIRNEKLNVGNRGSNWELPKTYESYIYGPQKDGVEKIPGLEGLVKTPFLLRIVMLTMKSLVEKYMKRKTNTSLSWEEKKIKFYDVMKGFIDHIYRRQVHKLTESDKLPDLSEGDDLTDLMEIFSQDLADDVWKNLIAVAHPTSVIHYTIGDKGSVWHKYFGKGKDTWGFKEYFKKDEDSLKKVRDGCPLKAVGVDIMFLHDALLDYYLHTRAHDREEFLSKKALEEIAKNLLPVSERDKPVVKTEAEIAYDAFN